MEIETLDDQMIRRQTVTRMAGFLVGRKTAGSREPGARWRFRVTVNREPCVSRFACHEM